MTVLNLAKIGEASVSSSSLAQHQLSIHGQTEKLFLGSKAESEIPVSENTQNLLKIYVQQNSLDLPELKQALIDSQLHNKLKQSSELNNLNSTNIIKGGSNDLDASPRQNLRQESLLQSELLSLNEFVAGGEDIMSYRPSNYEKPAFTKNYKQWENKRQLVTSSIYNAQSKYKNFKKQENQRSQVVTEKIMNDSLGFTARSKTHQTGKSSPYKNKKNFPSGKKVQNMRVENSFSRQNDTLKPSLKKREMYTAQSKVYS